MPVHPTALSHGHLCKPQHGHHCIVDSVLKPSKCCTSNWRCFSISADCLPLRFALNNCRCPTTHSWPGCGNCNFHAPRALDAHRWGLWHSPMSPTLSTEVTYQPRFFLTATCPSLDSMPVKKQKCYEMKFIALKGIAHKLSSPLTFCMSNFCSFVFSHIQCPETVT